MNKVLSPYNQLKDYRNYNGDLLSLVLHEYLKCHSEMKVTEINAGIR